MADKKEMALLAITCSAGGNCKRILQGVFKVAEFWLLVIFYLFKQFLLYHINLQLTLM